MACCALLSYRDWFGTISSLLFDPALGLVLEPGAEDSVDGIMYLRLSEVPCAKGLSSRQTCAALARRLAQSSSVAAPRPKTRGQAG